MRIQGGARNCAAFFVVPPDKRSGGIAKPMIIILGVIPDLIREPMQPSRPSRYSRRSRPANGSIVVAALTAMP
jgi:hypothetical protein